MSLPRLVLMGRALGAFGTKGELRVDSYAQDPAVFSRAGRFLAGPDPNSARVHALIASRRHGRHLLFRVRGVDSREEAELLKGARIYLARADLQPPDEDEYYWADLKGAKISAAGGQRLGRIKGVSHNGEHELWHVEDDGGRELLIPITPGVIERMDLAEGQVMVNLTPGLLEAQGWEEPAGS